MFSFRIQQHSVPFSRLLAVMRDQGPFFRFIRNVVKGNIQGIISIRSHQRDNGATKVAYRSRDKAYQAVDAMQKKVNSRFSVYQCLYCDGFHIGKNADSGEGSNPADPVRVKH